MNIANIHPTDIGSSPKSGISELMHNFLVRTNFVPGLRNSIGWRGLRNVSLDVECWTARVHNSKGIFGIYFADFEQDDGWVHGRFGLNYFPAPDEKLVELFSLHAGRVTQDEKYLFQIGEFFNHPKLVELFNIGVINLCVNESLDALILSLESISHQQVIAKDGVSFICDGRKMEIVKPGEFDQDFPSFGVALEFFYVLAAAITFCLEETPGYFKKTNIPGTKVVYDSCGNHWELPSKQARKKVLSLGYGDADFDKKVRRHARSISCEHETVIRQMPE